MCVVLTIVGHGKVPLEATVTAISRTEMARHYVRIASAITCTMGKFREGWSFVISAITRGA